MPKPRPALATVAALALVACQGQESETMAPTPPPVVANPEENPTMPPEPTPAPLPAGRQIATFANGCFWCTEAVLEQLPGVLDVVSGYMGGEVTNPTYQQICTGETGHAECVRVTFDPTKVTFETLLEWFFRSHDPTTLNRQGADVGTQYRSAIFFHDRGQHEQALAAIAKYQPRFAKPIVTELSAASTFWPAEDYHQDYFRKHPNQGYCRAVIAPKLQKLGLEDAR